MPNTDHLLPNKTQYHWRLVKRNKHAVSLCTRVMFYSAAALACIGVASAEPTGMSVNSGSATMTTEGNATTIDTFTQDVDSNFDSFDTKSYESVLINQQNSSSNFIARVGGGVPTTFAGMLKANGRFFIINSAGITFTSTSQVNVGSLVASTASNFTADGDRYSFAHSGYAQVINEGNITVSDGGFAILAAPHVANSGVITANLGQIQLASASAYTLDLRGDGRITFTVDADALGDIEADGKALGIDNTGTLQARGGEIALTAATISKVVNSVVNLGGVVDADAFAADGNGGTVLAVSDGDLNVTGEVRARGGETSGDGGYVEVSGENLLLQGDIEVGAGGTIYIDPTDITIVDGSTAGVNEIAEEDIEADLAAGANVIVEADNSITMNDLTDDVLFGDGTGNLTLRTTGASSGDGIIAFADLGTGDGIADSIVTTRGDITIEAVGDNASITIGDVASVGDFLTLSTADQAAVLAGLDTFADDDGAALAAAMTGKGLANNAGDIVITSEGSVSVQNVGVASLVEGGTASASLEISAADDISVTGDVGVAAVSIQDSGTASANVDVEMQAGADGSGSLTINDDTFVGAALAVRTPGGKVDGGAVANADVDLLAGSNVDITTAGSTLVVGAAALNTAVNGTGAEADANLEIISGVAPEARFVDGGDITVSGPTAVVAAAVVTGSPALAVCSLGCNFSDLILGPAEADAAYNIRANNGTVETNASVSVTGETLVVAAADVTLTPIGDITIGGFTVDGSDDPFTAFESGLIGGADADADLDIDAAGTVTVDGGIAVGAGANALVDGNIAISSASVRARRTRRC